MATYKGMHLESLSFCFLVFNVEVVMNVFPPPNAYSLQKSRGYSKAAVSINDSCLAGRGGGHIQLRPLGKKVKSP